MQILKICQPTSQWYHQAVKGTGFRWLQLKAYPNLFSAVSIIKIPHRLIYLRLILDDL
jgi:hypothetical protein